MLVDHESDESSRMNSGERNGADRAGHGFSTTGAMLNRTSRGLWSRTEKKEAVEPRERSDERTDLNE
jgi:hypothetical protein